MPGYQLLRIGDAAKTWAEKVDSLKKAEKYAGNESALDTAIVKDLKGFTAQAAKWTGENAKMAANERTECKNRVDAAEKLLKTKQFGDKDLKAIEGFHQAIHKRLSALRQDNASLTQALAPQYRNNGWTKHAREALSDPSLVDKVLLANRPAEVKLGSTVIQYTRRVEEYADRIDEILKSAKIQLDRAGEFATLYKDMGGDPRPDRAGLPEDRRPEVPDPAQDRLLQATEEEQETLRPGEEDGRFLPPRPPRHRQGDARASEDDEDAGRSPEAARQGDDGPSRRLQAADEGGGGLPETVREHDRRGHQGRHRGREAVEEALRRRGHGGRVQM